MRLSMVMGASVLVLAIAFGAPAVASCSYAACVTSYSIDATCRAAADGSEQGFLHTLGSGSVKGNLLDVGYDDFLGDFWAGYSSHHSETNYPGPRDISWQAPDSYQGWLVPTTGHHVDYRVLMSINVHLSTLLGSDSQDNTISVACT